MNKRQSKKNDKKIKQRVSFFNSYIFYFGRQTSKTYMIRAIRYACVSKKYKYFKELKRYYEKNYRHYQCKKGVF